MSLLSDLDRLIFGIARTPKPELSFEEKVEQKARELHKTDSDKVGHSIMVGDRGAYNVSWPSWEEFSEEVRENYRKEARDLLEGYP
mgnify:CR=1 FL=1